MKLKIEKQTALKGLLLLAVLGNISFQPVLNSLDLSSEVAGGSKTASAPVQEAASAPKPPATAVGPSENGVRPDAPARVSEPVANEEALKEKPKRTETPKICNQRFYVTYKEIIFKDGDNSKAMTEISVKPHDGVVNGFKEIRYRKNGSLSENVDNSELKAELDQQITKAVKGRLGRCPGEEAPPIVDQDREGKSGGKYSDREERENLQRAIKECRLNQRGDPLPERDVVRCRLARLDQIDADEDNSSSRTRAIGQLERIIRGDVKKSIKNRLMSRDESKITEGEELLEEAMERVKDLTTDLRLDPSRAARLVKELESLKTGGETYRRSSELAADIRTAKDDLVEQLSLARAEAQANPRDMAAQQRYLSVQREVLMRQQQLTNQVQMDLVNGPYRQLQAMQQMGYMNSTEFSQFTQPYQALRQDLLSILQPSSVLPQNVGIGGMTQYSLPGDFINYRQGLSTSGPSFNVSVPQQQQQMLSPGIARPMTPQYGVPMTQQQPFGLGNSYGLQPNTMSPMANQLYNTGSAFQSFAPPNVYNVNAGRRF